MGMYGTFMEAIQAYTGLSPSAFFTILALMVAVYRLVCGMFVDPQSLHGERRDGPEQMAISPPAAPVQLGDIMEEELRAYDGSDSKKPLLMAIKGQVYDVSRSRNTYWMFYGPGGPYALFAGRDASRALALMSFDPKYLTGNIEGLEPSELEVLQDWEYKFMEKYVKVGQIVAAKSLTKETHTNDENPARGEEEADGGVKVGKGTMAETAAET